MPSLPRDQLDVMFRNRMTDIYQNADLIPEDNIGKSDLTYIERERLKAMAETYLEEGYDEHLLSELEGLQRQFNRCRAELWRKFQNQNIAEQELTAQLEKSAVAMFTAMEQVLGRENFLRMFGAPPSEVRNLFNAEATG